ncbi:MAG: Asp23/Gls24 family envelope stress response protein [bacterium]|nr:Asp23/Gls24 family envelope stress response protein [Candidatus Sumerlaeota bacterium]
MSGQEDLGNITINDDVAANYASLAILEVDGVTSVSGKGSFSDYVGAKSKDVDKGVSIKIDPATNACTVNVEVNIDYGINIYETARKLQRAVKNSIENYVGLAVEKVNITIRGLVIDEEPRTNSRS